MCNLYITSQYTFCSNSSFISFERHALMHFFDMSLKPSKRRVHRFRFLCRNGWSLSSAYSCKVFSGGRSSLTAQYSAHAPRNVLCPSPQWSSKKIILQFLQASFSERYPSFPFSCWNALKTHSFLTSFRELKCKIVLASGRFRRVILLYKQMGLKKWLTAIEDPTECLLEGLCVIFTNTLGLKVFFSPSFLKNLFASSKTRSAWASLPLTSSGFSASV